MKENSAAVYVHLPIQTATYLLNEKRREISVLESKIGTPIVIVPTPELETPHYRIRRLRSEELEQESEAPSFKIAMEKDEAQEEVETIFEKPKEEKAAIGQFVHGSAAPPRKPEPKDGLLTRLFRFLFGDAKKQTEHRKPQHRGQRRDNRPQGRKGPQRPRPQKKAGGGGAGQRRDGNRGGRQEGERQETTPAQGQPQAKEKQGGRGRRGGRDRKGNRPQRDRRPPTQQNGNVANPGNQANPESANHAYKSPDAQIPVASSNSYSGNANREDRIPDSGQSSATAEIPRREPEAKASQNTSDDTGQRQQPVSQGGQASPNLVQVETVYKPAADNAHASPRAVNQPEKAIVREDKPSQTGAGEHRGNDNASTASSNLVQVETKNGE